MTEWTVTDTCGNGRFTVLRRGPNSELPDVDMGNERDAYLAAAAPLMYEALRAMTADYDAAFLSDPEEFIMRHMPQVKAALTAAGGE